MKSFKMKKVFYLLMIVITIGLISCTEGQRARAFGGTMTVTIPKGEKFVNATWKQADLWIITQDTFAKVYYMHEISDYGIFQGTVIIQQ